VAQPNDKGFTLLEAMLSATLIVTLSYLVATLAISARRAELVARRQVTVLETNRDLLASIHTTLENAVFLPQNNAAGNAYLQVLDISGLPPSINSTLPTLDVSGIFEKEKSSAVKTGNLLVYAVQERTDEFQCSSGKVCRIEVYRFYAYYLTKRGVGPSDQVLNLAKFVSEPLADGWTVDLIADATDQAEVLAHLRDGTPDRFGDTNEPLEVVWFVGGDLTDPDTLRLIAANGKLKQNRPGGWKILSQPELCSADLLRYRRLGVATNALGPALKLGKFGVIDNTGDGFPHGLEVQIIDTLDARQVLIRLLIIDTLSRGRAYSDKQIVAYVPNGLTS